MNRKDKEARVIRWLTESHINAYGGYPYDFEIHAGKLFVASLDDGKDRNRTTIDVYDVKSLAAWYNDALSQLIQNRDSLEWPEKFSFDFGDWSGAFYETSPEVRA